MNFLNTLFNGTEGVWSGGIAHSIIILALVIALGKIMGKIKVAGISFGVTWILFIGIAFSHFGMTLDPNLLQFLKEFGLILFVYSIGLQVGPGFFASLKSGGIGLNLLAFLVVLLGVGITVALHFITGESITTMTGIMSGAVTNTPGLGAAQQAYSDIYHTGAPDIALGYAVAYPLGVIGCILSFVVLKGCFYGKALPVRKPKNLDDKKIEIPEIEKAEHLSDSKYISRRIIISKRKLNGMVLGKLEFEKVLGATVTRIRRAGIELKATPEIRLQYGDQVTVVGSEQSIAAVEKVLGNMGIALGCILGSIPIVFPGIPQPVKLGLAGGPLVVSLLISHFGPQFKVVTYTTASANLMLREIGIAIFLACVGLEAGHGFVDTIIHQGGCNHHGGAHAARRHHRPLRDEARLQHPDRRACGLMHQSPCARLRRRAGQEQRPCRSRLRHRLPPDHVLQGAGRPNANPVPGLIAAFGDTDSPIAGTKSSYRNKM